jgi:hypothetical protein
VNVSTGVVDRTARDSALQLLARWSAGKITNWHFEDAWPTSTDRGVRAIGDRLWCFYTDFPKKPIDVSSLDPDARGLFERCVSFLEGETEYRWPDFDFQREGLKPLETLYRGKGTKARRWEAFTRAGDIAWWPFLDGADYERTIGRAKRPK